MVKLVKIIICLFVFYTAQSQVKDYNRYTDFHIHTSFKHYYKDVKSASEVLNSKSDLSLLNKKFGKINWKNVVNKKDDLVNGRTSTIKNYNQSDFSNLKNLPGSILCTSLYPYEKQFAISGIKRLISSWQVSGIPLSRLKNIGSDSSSPIKEFEAEYIFLKSQEVVDPFGSFRIELARDRNDLIRILSTPNSTAQVLTIEGGQVLYGDYNGSRKHKFVLRADTDSLGRLEVLKNVDFLRRLDHKVFFLTPAHFTDNRIVGFSKTLDRDGILRKLLKNMSKSGLFRLSFFSKFGEGIHGDLDIGDYDEVSCDGVKVSLPYTRKNKFVSKATCMEKYGFGFDIIKSLLAPDSANSKRILIDVKHMDIQARFEYYDLIAQYSGNSADTDPTISL